MTGDGGDRAILAAIERRGHAPVRDVWWCYARWHCIPGTAPEIWDEYADKFVEMFSRSGDRVLYSMTQHARQQVAELN